MGRPSAPEHVVVRKLEREVLRNAERGMYCGAEMTNAPDSIAMWRTVASHPSLSSAVGAIHICGP